VNLVSARFPTTERKEQIPIPDALIKEILPTGDYHDEEERRLFYVGMTRARDLLYFTGAKYYGEGKREKKLSPFIEETVGKQKITIETNQQQLSFLDWQKTEESVLKPKRIVSYLSYSQLDTFKTCPLQYKYRYIVKIPVPPRAALTFGDTIHKVMHAFYSSVQKGNKLTKEDLLGLLDEHWSSLGFGDRAYEQKLKRQGRDILAGFYEKGYDPKGIPTSLEEPFRIKITPTLTLGGKIDRIDTLRNGTIEIIDYKTGTAPKSRDASKDLQLTVYAMAAGPKKVIVSFYFFDGQQKISATREKEQLEQGRKEIIKIADDISKSDFRPIPGKHCDFCEFRLICEAWN
jgi:DNA helicase-2/ATP-dependent DNA helicase PcrA